jgi:hypothetical protein
MAVSALMMAWRSAGPNDASARSVSLSVSAAMASSRDRPRSVSRNRTSRRSLGCGSRNSRPAAADPWFPGARQAWDQATLEAVAWVLPEVHAI